MAKPSAQKKPDGDAVTQVNPASPEMILLRKHVDERLNGLRTERYSFWQHWSELARYILPRRYLWLVMPNKGNRGSPINQNIIDSTGTLAARTCSSGMLAGMASPGRPWFKLAIDNDELAALAPVKIWLDEVQRRMLRIFAESNFYNAMAVLLQDLVVFGTGAMLIYEDAEDVIRCQNSAVGEYYLANSARHEIDTFYREFVLSTRQVADTFGLENCSENIKAAMRSGGAMLGKEIKIGHAIEPNPDHVAGAFGMKGMKYREVYWELGSAQNLTLRVRGFHEAPHVAPRWDIIDNDAYGRSPGMDALGDIKQLQVMTKREAQAIDKKVNPPLIADVSLKNQPASVLPGGVTYVQSTQGGVGFKPVYEVNPDLADFKVAKDEVKARINETFFKDLFLMLSQMEGVQPRNELEISERKEEKLIVLGPVLERFENECLDKAIDRSFNIAMRAGLFPPVPQELSGAHIKVEYVSMLAQAQRSVSTTAVERFFAFVGNLAAGKPETLDNVDFDEAVDQYADLMGISPKIVVATAKVAQIRQARAQQQQAQAAMQATQAAVQGAQTLSQTDVGGGQNALQMMLNGGERAAA